MNSIFKTTKRLVAGAVMATALFSGAAATAEVERDVSKYNMVEGENLGKYDPVSYFPEGGASPLVGELANRLDYMGVTYYFATTNNRDLFLQNPSKYEPTYGQWCAWAMASGSYIKINPLVYTLNENRLHFFINARAKRNFDADLVTNEGKADLHWKELSGEDPRN